jgi:hypothetical protein
MIGATREVEMYNKKFFPIILGMALAGCASSGGRHETSTSNTEPAAAAPAPDIAFTVPPESNKRLVLNMDGAPVVTQAKDWPAMQEEWRATFADHAKAAGITLDVQKGEAHATGETGTLLKVYVNDYRMVGIGSRIFFGVMTGNAYIDAKASFLDVPEGTAFGDRTYNTSSNAWAGVFAKMTPQQVDAIASDVFRQLGVAQ